MTVLELLSAYANRRAPLVIKDEFDCEIVRGADVWAFVIEKHPLMKYEELHNREVDCFLVDDGAIIVRLKEVKDK